MATEKAAPEKKPTAGHTFDVTVKDGDKEVTKKFKTTIARLIIPGVNENQPMTSLEISKSKAAQDYLVSVGSPAIEEVAK